MLGMATTESLLLARLEELRVARQIGLRVPRTEGRLLAGSWQPGRLVIPVVADVVSRLVSPIHAGFTAIEGRGLPELFLRRGNQAEIMLSVLEVVLGGNRISRRLRITRKLQILLRNMGRGAAYFDIRPV